jgi:hypothetical protein
MRAANRFPLMSTKVEQRIQAEVLNAHETVTDELLTEAIEKDSDQLLFLDKTNPILFIMKLCDRIIERQAISQVTEPPQD